MPLVTGSRVGPYEIVAPLGAGRMGEVSRDADGRARFRREAELLATLNHTNIATLYGLEEADRQSAIVMELVEGETLAERLAPVKDWHGLKSVPYRTPVGVSLQAGPFNNWTADVRK